MQLHQGNFTEFFWVVLHIIPIKSEKITIFLQIFLRIFEIIYRKRDANLQEKRLGAYVILHGFFFYFWLPS